MSLLPEDSEWLASCGHPFRVFEHAGATCVVLTDIEFAAYSPDRSNVLIRLPGSYPNGAPDMFWVEPWVRLPNGSLPRNADVAETFDGRSWQRWSRHYPGPAWRPHVDRIRTYWAWVMQQIAAAI